MTMTQKAMGTLVAITLGTAGIVAAQTTGTNVSVTTTTSTPSAGTAMTLANVEIENTTSTSVTTSQVPLTLTLGGNAAASSLSNCRLHNASGTALTNAVAPISGSNTFTLTSAVTTGANSTTALTLRCDVASGIPSGATFQFSSTAAPTAPSGTSLGVTLNATPRIAPGTPDALLALVIMQAGTNNAVQISSLPVSMTFANGVAASHLSDCRVRNVTSLANSLNTSVPTIASGTNTFSLASPLTIGSSSTVTLAVTCDIAANAPLGGTIGLSLTPSSIPATVSGSGVSVTPIVGQAVGGGTGPTSGTVTISNVTAPTVPGVPNTGSGNALSVAVLALSAVLVFGAFAILMRRKVI